eukprot:236841_1
MLQWKKPYNKSTSIFAFHLLLDYIHIGGASWNYKSIAYHFKVDIHQEIRRHVTISTHITMLVLKAVVTILIIDIFTGYFHTNLNTFIKLTSAQIGIKCADIEWSGSVWGTSYYGANLSAYTDDQLQFIGCASSSCFYCSDTSTSITFGGTTTLRTLVGSGTIPSTGGTCCSVANPRGFCNSPDDQVSITELCIQLGYDMGTFTRNAGNTCPEAHWNGSWTSDYERTAGYGREITCMSLTPAPTSAPTTVPTYHPSSAPTRVPTYHPSQNPSQKPTQNPTIQPTDPTLSPTKPTRQPTSPTRQPTNPTSHPTNPTSSPTYPTRTPTNPTPNPTDTTQEPTHVPTNIPPTSSPLNPTAPPTENPTSLTQFPTENPTRSPTDNPTLNPTQIPTKHPTRSPTDNPTVNPTEAPTANPTLITRSPSETPSGNPTPPTTGNPTLYPSLNPFPNPTPSPVGPPIQVLIFQDNDDQASVSKMWIAIGYVILMLSLI